MTESENETDDKPDDEPSGPVTGRLLKGRKGPAATKAKPKLGRYGVTPRG